jgi:thymidine phosphorylase
VREVTAPTEGYVSRLHALPIARAALELGAGRKQKTDAIDHAAGIELLRKTGDAVRRGEPVARLHGERNVEKAERLMGEAIDVSESPVAHPPPILEVVR